MLIQQLFSATLLTEKLLGLLKCTHSHREGSNLRKSVTNRPTSWPSWLRFGFVYKVSPLKSQHFFKFVNSHKMMTFHQAENRGRFSQVYSDIIRYWYSMIFPSSIGVWGFEVRPTLLGPAPPYLQVQCPRKRPPTGSAQARITKPIGSMHGIFTDIWLIMGNVGKYTMDIHGSYGKWLVDHQQPWLNKKKWYMVSKNWEARFLIFLASFGN